MTQFLGESFTHQNPAEYGEGKKVTTKILTTDAENTENLNKRLTTLEQNNNTPHIKYGNNTTTLNTITPQLELLTITTPTTHLHTQVTQTANTTIHKYLSKSTTTTYTYTIKTPTQNNLAGSTSTVLSNSPIGQYCTATDTEVPSFNNDNAVVVWVKNIEDNGGKFIRWCQENLNIIVQIMASAYTDAYTIYKSVHTISTFKSTHSGTDTAITDYTHNKIEGTIVVDTDLMEAYSNNDTITLTATILYEVDFPEMWQLANRRETGTLGEDIDTFTLSYPAYTSTGMVMMQVYQNNELLLIGKDYTLLDNKTIQLTNATEDDLIEVIYNTRYSQTPENYEVHIEAILTDQITSTDVTAYYAQTLGWDIY